MDSAGSDHNTSVWGTIYPFELIDELDLINAVDRKRTQIDDWIEARSIYFDPLGGNNSSERFVYRTAAAESSIYLYAARNIERSAVAPTLHDLITTRANDYRYYRSLLRNQQRAPEYLPAMYYTKNQGKLSDEADAVVETVLQGEPVWATERLPYRQLDLWQACLAYGYSDCRYDSSMVHASSCLAYKPDVIASGITEAIALAHDLLYYYNFGVDHTAFPNKSAPYNVADILTGFILRFMSCGNCDLVSELLIAGILHRQLSADFVRFSVSWLVEQVNRLGYVPGIDFDRGRGPSDTVFNHRFTVDTSSWDDSRREWAYNYHPALIFGILARILQRDWSALERSELSWTRTGEGIEYLFKLGRLLDTLSSYDLMRAADQLSELSCTPAIEHKTFADAVAFVRSQETPSGQYGYWPKEQELHTKFGGTHENFEYSINHPVTEACIRALQTIGSKQPENNE